MEPFISCINRQVRIELCSSVGYSTWRLYELLLHCQDQTGKDPRAEGSIQAYGFRSFKSTVIGKASRVVFTAVGASNRILTSPQPSKLVSGSFSPSKDLRQENSSLQSESQVYCRCYRLLSKKESLPELGRPSTLSRGRFLFEFR